MNNKTLKNIGLIFVIIGFVFFLATAIWTMKLSFCFLKSAVGSAWSIAAFLFAPALLILIPWYLLFAQGQFFPVIISYGGLFIAFIVISIGRAFYNSSSDDNDKI